MPRKNTPNSRPQRHRGKARSQGLHKKQRSEGLSHAVRDLERNAAWWRPDEEAAA